MHSRNYNSLGRFRPIRTNQYNNYNAAAPLHDNPYGNPYILNRVPSEEHYNRTNQYNIEVHSFPVKTVTTEEKAHYLITFLATNNVYLNFLWPKSEPFFNMVKTIDVLGEESRKICDFHFYYTDPAKIPKAKGLGYYDYCGYDYDYWAYPNNYNYYYDYDYWTYPNDYDYWYYNGGNMYGGGGEENEKKKENEEKEDNNGDVMIISEEEEEDDDDDDEESTPVIPDTPLSQEPQKATLPLFTWNSTNQDVSFNEWDKYFSPAHKAISKELDVEDLGDATIKLLASFTVLFDPTREKGYWHFHNVKGII